MKRIIWVTLLSISIAVLVSSCGKPIMSSARWYTPEQVATGKPLYAKYCAGCHGENGQGGANWETALPNGSYPPQPLNESGHAWHHSLAQLEETIADGGKHPGATMPGFSGVLNKDERLAVISAFQSFWGDRTYSGWLGRGGLSK